MLMLGEFHTYIDFQIKSIFKRFRQKGNETVYEARSTIARHYTICFLPTKRDRQKLARLCIPFRRPMSNSALCQHLLRGAELAPVTWRRTDDRGRVVGRCIVTSYRCRNLCRFSCSGNHWGSRRG